MAFIKNNLAYRRSASLAIAEYKHSESMMLADLIEGSHRFNETPREILQLMFAEWFKWAMATERYLLPIKFIEQSDIQYLLDSVDETVTHYLQIMEEHSDVFLQNVTCAWKELHRKVTVRYLKARIKQLEGSEPIQAFPIVMSLLAECLNYTLFELHEVDCVANCGLADDGTYQRIYYVPDSEGKPAIDRRHSEQVQPFMSVDSLCFRFFALFKESPVRIRFELYRQRYNFNPKRLSLKVYVDLMDGSMDEVAITPLKEAGADIGNIE